MIRRVGSGRGRRLTGLYAIEGTRLVERALRAGARPESVLVAAQLAATPDPRHAALFDALRTVGCPVVVAPDAVVAELTEGRDLGQVLALLRLPPATTLDALLSLAPPPPRPPALLLAAIDITDPGNVGALTRTAHAAGATALLAVGASDPFHPRATRISRGSIFRLPVIYYADTGELFDDLRRCGVIAVGTAAAGGAPLPAFAWPARPTAVLMGNEAEGLPPELAAVLDFTVTIPMTAGVDSYSVNAAAAIVCFVRQSAVLVGPELN